jgi:hypothetical protein
MQSSDPERPPSIGSSIRDAQRAAPTTTRIFYGGYLLLAMSAAVVSWKIAPSGLVQIALILVILTVVTSLLTVALSKPSNLAAQALLWLILVALCISLGAFISASLFGWPEPARILAARFLGQETLAASRATEGTLVRGDDATLPPEVSEPPHTAGDRFNRIAELSKRRTVTLAQGSIHVSGPLLHFGVLRLQNANLIFEGSELTIEAVRIEVEGQSAVRSAALTAGPSNGTGASGGNLKLIVYDRISGKLSIDLGGGPGGKGPAGEQGVNGANGAPGENSSQSLFDCRHGGGQGGAGLPGGKGGDGGLGYPGGDGGALTLVASETSQAARAINFMANGGSGGRGGDAGRGGLGGHGGPGGHGGGYCGGGQAGPEGPPGPPGQPGPNGQQGHEGKFNVRDLAVEVVP